MVVASAPQGCHREQSCCSSIHALFNLELPFRVSNQFVRVPGVAGEIDAAVVLALIASLNFFNASFFCGLHSLFVGAVRPKSNEENRKLAEEFFENVHKCIVILKLDYRTSPR